MMNLSNVTSVTNFVQDKYEHYVYYLADPRTQNWYLISSPIPTLIIIGIYLLLIYKVLPRFMIERPPYNIQNVIFYYNIYQILACSFIVYEVVTPFSEPSFAWVCEPFSYSNTPRSQKMLNICYFIYLLKLSELIETMLFVLRKKFNQVSKLHVYHHVSTLLTAWFYTKYFGGGMTTFSMMLNSFVHIFMYTYYLLASLGPYWQKKMAKWKSKLTCLQMLQFCVLIGHALQAFNPNCGIPLIMPLMYIPNIALIFQMFWAFYKKNYFLNLDKKLI